MTGPNKPDEPGKTVPDASRPPQAGGRDELDRRGRALDEALAAKRPAASQGGGRDGPAAGGAAGFGQAVRLSSEFVAGVAVGAGLGWLIDNVAGTSPWGLIVFLLLGFAAGVLNVLRASGKVAEPEMRVKKPDAGKRDED